MSQAICGKLGPDSEDPSTLVLAAVWSCAVMVPCVEDSSASHTLALQALDGILRTAAADARALWSGCFLPCFIPHTCSLVEGFHGLPGTCVIAIG